MRQDRQTKRGKREAKKRPPKPRGKQVLYVYQIDKNGLIELPEVWAMP